MTPLEEKLALEGLTICEERSRRAVDEVLHALTHCEAVRPQSEAENNARFYVELGLLHILAELERIHFAAQRGKPSG